MSNRSQNNGMGKGLIWGSFFVVVILLGVYVGPHIGWMFKGKKRPGHDGEAASFVDRLVDTYAASLKSVDRKVRQLDRLEADNAKLRAELDKLRIWSEGLDKSCKMKEGEAKTVAAKKQLEEQTGSVSGRTLAQIDYRSPESLNSTQLFTLAVSYFKAREDEKASVILAQLAEDGEDPNLRSARTYLMAGVSFYRLDNYKQAGEYFDKTLKTEANADNLKFHAQARLWQGLTALKLKKPQLAQQWFGELIDHHPKSPEARWVNSAKNKEASRVPAHSDEP